MDKKVVMFIFDRETKNTVRYAEQVPQGHLEIVGTLYMQKLAIGVMAPTAIRVTIEEV